MEGLARAQMLRDAHKNAEPSHRGSAPLNDPELRAALSSDVPSRFGSPSAIPTSSDSAAPSTAPPAGPTIPQWPENSVPQPRRTLGPPNDIQNLTELPPMPIQMIDNTQEPNDYSSAIWARNVFVGQANIVQGSDKAGAYAVWTCTIETKTGSRITIRKRYSDFVALREALCFAFPQRVGEIPKLPPKSVVSKFRAEFLSERRKGLEWFLACVILNPVFCGSPIVKDFVRTG